MKNKKFLFVATDLNIGFHIINTRNEGNHVKVYSTVYKENYLKGFIPDSDWIDDWKKYTNWADVIVFDDVGWGKEADKLRKQGKFVVGGTEYTDKLEMDREFGQNELKKRGIPVLKEHEFKTIEKLIRFIKKHPKRYVLKPCGIHDMDMTIVGELENGEDLLDLIILHKELWQKKGVKSFFLQEYINGIEIATACCFNGKEFVYPIEINFEHKRLFNNDLGPMTWEMGTLMHYTKPNKFFKNTVYKFKDQLKKSGFVGDIDLNCIINSKGIYPLEFTCRFGFPATQILWEGNHHNSSDYLHGIASGNLKDRYSSKGYNIGVVICLPPFPFNDKKEMEKYKGALIKIKNNDLKGVYFVDVVKHNNMYLANGYCPMIVCAKAESVKKAREEVYSRIKKINIENMYYRTDIGNKWEKQSKLLRRWGWID